MYARPGYVPLKQAYLFKLKQKGYLHVYLLELSLFFGEMDVMLMINIFFYDGL